MLNRRLIIDSSFLETWHPRYDEIERDEPEYQDLVATISNELSVQHTLSKGTFVRVLDWKAPRLKGIVRLDSFSEYQDGIAAAFRAENDQKLGVLCKLYGIGGPVGSTFLHLMYPNRFPIIDIRTAQTLLQAGLVTSQATDLQRYPAFVVAIFEIAVANPSFTLREIDRALFAYHKIILSPSLTRKTVGTMTSGRTRPEVLTPTTTPGSLPMPLPARKNVKPTIRDKVVAIFADKTGMVFSKKQIVDLVAPAYQTFPETKPRSVMPSDYCYNLINADPNSFKLHGFEYLPDGDFRWLGLAYPYTGSITWINEQVGNWTNGHCDIWNDPRKKSS